MKNELDSLLNRVDMRLAACAAAAGASLAVVPQADADIVYSGVVNIVIPDNIDGIYMNVVTGAFGAAPPAGWDINPYSATAGMFNLWGPTTATWLSTGAAIGGPYNLAMGTLIGPGGTFFRPGGGTNVGLEMNLNSSNNFLGFVFTNEALGNQVQYGWIQIQFGATLSDRTIIGYAYENTGVAIGAGAIPEPSTFALLGVMAAGALGVRAWRGRKAA